MGQRLSSSKQYCDNDYINQYQYIAQKYYVGRDFSHNFDHVLKVASNVDEILKDFGYNYDGYEITSNDAKILFAAALFHDAYDHKYKGYLSQEEFEIQTKDMIRKDLKKFNTTIEIKDIFSIIDNISFSKERRNRPSDIPLEGRLLLLRNIVSDADKIEALGMEAAKRMIAYEKIKDCKKETLIKNIRQHCDDKLYILISEKYIRTNFGIKIAQELEKELRDIVSNDDRLDKLIDQGSI